MSHNPLSLAGKTILVTGASSGIGRETAILLSKLEAKVILIGRDSKRLKQTESMMQHNEHITLELDLTNYDMAFDTLTKVCNKTKPLDGLVHAAGIQTTVPLQFTSLEIIQAALQSNLISSCLLMKFFRQKNISAQPAACVLMSSVTALFGQSGLALYAATKGAIISLTKSLSVELSRQKIRVNCIIPGLVNTQMTQNALKQMSCNQRKNWEASHLLGIGEPIDIANMAAFLIADASKWITGSSFIVDGGFSAHKVIES